MTLTLTELNAVASEIEEILLGGIVQDVEQVAPHAVDVCVAATSGVRRVRLNVRPGLSRMHLVSVAETARTPGYSHFAEKARALLVGGVIERVALQYGDRVAALVIRTGEGCRILLFECSGHHPNLFILDEKRVVLSMLNETMSHKRLLAVGRPYAKPLRHPMDAIDTLRFVSAPGHLSEAIEAAYQAQDARQDHIDSVEALKRSLSRTLGRLAVGTPLHGEVTEVMKALLLGQDGAEARARELAARLDRPWQPPVRHERRPEGNRPLPRNLVRR